MLQVNVLEGDSFRRTRLLRMLFSNFFHHSGKINADILEGGFLPFDTMQSRSILRGVLTLTDTIETDNPDRIIMGMSSHLVPSKANIRGGKHTPCATTPHPGVRERLGKVSPR